MTNAEFIRQHRQDDVRSLALKKAPSDVDLPYCLTQIEGWQTARAKLPHWAESDGIIFPPRLSMEQCSSQLTAQYKAQALERFLQGEYPHAQSGGKGLPIPGSRLADLTGGFAVDFSFMSPLFTEATYVERQSHLCEIAQHNLSVLGIRHARVLNVDAHDALAQLPHQTAIFLDPARRDEAGRKVVALADCTPDVAQLHDALLDKADVVMVKLSPMLDISQSLSALPTVREVHVVSVEGECKELLLILSRVESGLTYHCVNLGRTTQSVVVEASRSKSPVIVSSPQRYLYEPNASILKADVQDALCQQFGIEKLHPFSHLFTSEECRSDFPGRIFEIERSCGFGKKELKEMLADIRQANLTIRNFPATVAELRRRLRLSEGGNVYLFATTLADGSHALIRCRRAF